MKTNGQIGVQMNNFEKDLEILLTKYEKDLKIGLNKSYLSKMIVDYIKWLEFYYNNK